MFKFNDDTLKNLPRGVADSLQALRRGGHLTDAEAAEVARSVKIAHQTRGAASQPVYSK